jgi:rhamnogalacturonan endolyase
MKNPSTLKKSILHLLIIVICCAACSGSADEYTGEKLDRGVVAFTIDLNSIYVGWRLLKEDPADIAFNVYRMDIGKADYVKVNREPVTASTNFVDTDVVPDMGYRYKITALSGGIERETPGEGYVFNRGMNQPYISIKLKDDIVANKIGIADLTGDGAYDFVIQHPQFNTDPWYVQGYWRRSSEPYKLDAYSSKGEFLWRYDMGWAIETGTWYAPYLVYDIDGDGKAEVYTKAGEGDPREPDGHVLTGNEYLVRIDGKTGKITGKMDWISREGFESYNRWSRNFLTLAYFDGSRPSLVMLRGTYGLIKISALDKDLGNVWEWESTGEYESFKSRGGHSILVADITGDGRDELIPGTFAIGSDGVPLWQVEGLRHNDVGYIADIDPDRPGLEIFYGMEQRLNKNGVCLVDARTGEIIWGYQGDTYHIHGQGMVGNIDARSPGMECFAGEQRGESFYLYNAQGVRLSDKGFGVLSPRAIWWDSDDLKEINVRENVFKYQGDTLLQIEGRIIAVADILGDWREEIITSLPGEIRIYSTNIPAHNRKVCLMQDRQYRIGVANYSMGYTAPPQLGITKK